MDVQKRKTLGKTSRRLFIFRKTNGVEKREMQNLNDRCETQFKIEKNTFSKMKFFLSEKRKSTKGIEKPRRHFKTKVCFKVPKIEKKTQYWRCEG